jgi:hypothetical protein
MTKLMREDNKDIRNKILYYNGAIPAEGRQLTPDNPRFFEGLNDVLERYRDVAMAQLTYSSDDKARINKVMSKQGYNSKQVENMMKMVDLAMKEDDGNHIKTKQKALKWMGIRRGLSRVVQVAGGAYVIPVVYGSVGAAAYGVGAEVVDFVKDGWQKHVAEWGNVLKGNFSVAKDSAGHYTTGLNPLQKAVLEVKSFTEQTIEPPDAQRVTLGNQVVSIPSTVEVKTVGSEVLWINKANGDIENMTGVRMEDRGTAGFVLVNPDGSVRSENPLFGGGYVNEIKDTPKVTLLSKDVKMIDSTIDGHPVKIPEGTEWVKDANGKLDLIVQGHRDLILIDDAEFDKSGQMTIGGKHPMVNWDEARTVKDVPQVTAAHSETTMKRVDTIAEWQKHATEVDHRQWHTANQLNFYDVKNVNGNVELDLSKVNTLKGHDRGFYFTLEGNEQKGIFVPADPNGKITLDPSSTKVIPGSNGLTMGELTKMVVNQDAMKNFTHASELTRHPEIFNLETAGAHPGHIEAAWKEGNVLHVGATVTGTSHIPPTMNVGAPTLANTVITHQAVTSYSQNLNLNDAITERQTVRVPIIASIPVFSSLDVAKLAPFPLLFRTNIERSLGTHGGHTHDSHGPGSHGSSEHDEQTPAQEEAPAEVAVTDQERAAHVERRDQLNAELDRDIEQVQSGAMTEQAFELKWTEKSAVMASQRQKVVLGKMLREILKRKETEFINQLPPDEKTLYQKAQGLLASNLNVVANINAAQAIATRDKPIEERSAIHRQIVETQLRDAGIPLTADEYQTFLSITTAMTQFLRVEEAAAKKKMETIEGVSLSEGSTPVSTPPPAQPARDEEESEGESAEEENAESVAAEDDDVTGVPEPSRASTEAANQASDETRPEGE